MWECTESGESGAARQARLRQPLQTNKRRPKVHHGSASPLRMQLAGASSFRRTGNARRLRCRQPTCYSSVVGPVRTLDSHGNARVPFLSRLQRSSTADRRTLLEPNPVANAHATHTQPAQPHPAHTHPAHAHTSGGTRPVHTHPRAVTHPSAPVPPLPVGTRASGGLAPDGVRPGQSPRPHHIVSVSPERLHCALCTHARTHARTHAHAATHATAALR
jgi:hypothetical protein